MTVVQVVVLLTALLCPVLTGACDVRNMTIEGTSLAPRISNGETITVEIGTDCQFEPTRGDVVLIHSSAYHIPIAKAVTAMPGDSWRVMPDGSLWVNGAQARNSEGRAYDLTESAMRLLTLYSQDYGEHIPEDVYLVMGESFTGSLDSSRLGLIHRRDIIGRQLPIKR